MRVAQCLTHEIASPRGVGSSNIRGLSIMNPEIASPNPLGRRNMRGAFLNKVLGTPHRAVLLCFSCFLCRFITIPLVGCVLFWVLVKCSV